MSYNCTVIVFDSSTLILAARIEILEIFLNNMRTEVLIPAMVKKEILAEEREETPILTKLLREETIQVVTIKKRIGAKRLIQDFHLHRGEAEAILLALEAKAQLLATDDRNAIRACRLLKIPFTTALAILVRAHEKGLIEKEVALAKLRRLEQIARYKAEMLVYAQKQIKGGRN